MKSIFSNERKFYMHKWLSIYESFKENIWEFCFDWRIKIYGKNIYLEIKYNHKYSLFYKILNNKNIELMSKIKR